MHPIQHNDTTAPPVAVIYRPLPAGIAFVEYGSPPRRIVNTAPPLETPYRWGWLPARPIGGASWQ